jgi:hypothetical protein
MIYVLDPKTLKSAQGILQNASGWHNGTRVWGGGIVSVPAEEWEPWFVDLDPERNSSIANPKKDSSQPVLLPWQVRTFIFGLIFYENDILNHYNRVH